MITKALCNKLALLCFESGSASFVFNALTEHDCKRETHTHRYTSVNLKRWIDSLKPAFENSDCVKPQYVCKCMHVYLLWDFVVYIHLENDNPSYNFAAACNWNFYENAGSLSICTNIWHVSDICDQFSQFKLIRAMLFVSQDNILYDSYLLSNLLKCHQAETRNKRRNMRIIFFTLRIENKVYTAHLNVASYKNL